MAKEWLGTGVPCRALLVYEVKMTYEAKVLADSVGPNGVRLATLTITLPRIVLAEFNTHRMFSRNSASSRAIPIEKMIQRVMNSPFIPESWGANQKGMQAEREIVPEAAAEARHHWLMARDKAVTEARMLLSLGVHKQLANRLLEPFSWTTILVTATEWSNFFALRRHRDAQPEIRQAADAMWQVLEASIPKSVKERKPHLPLCDDLEDLQFEGFSTDAICKIVAGRCARVSYLTHDGKRDPRADLELADRLLASGHMSPFEHVGFATNELEWSGNFRGWRQYRKDIANESVYKG